MRDRECGPPWAGRGWPPWEGRGWGPRGGGQGGPGGGFRERMERGLLRLIVLDVLHAGPKHGYEIIKELEERTQGRYSPSPGTVYPTLQYLSDLGLITSNQEGDRRVYALTDAGRAERETHSEKAEGFWTRFGGPFTAEGSRAEIEFLQDELSELMRTVWGRLRPAFAQGDDATIRQVREAVERCKNDVRTIIARASEEEAPG